MQFGELFDADLSSARSGPVMLDVLSKVFGSNKPISVEEFSKDWKKYADNKFARTVISFKQ